MTLLEVVNDRISVTIPVPWIVWAKTDLFDGLKKTAWSGHVWFMSRGSGRYWLLASGFFCGVAQQQARDSRTKPPVVKKNGDMVFATPKTWVTQV